MPKPSEFCKISHIFGLGKHRERKHIHRKKAGDTLQAQLGIQCACLASTFLL